MSTDRKLVFFHGPKTRSTGVFILLEELGAPYDLRLVNMKIMEHRQPAFLAINPMGKVPALEHEGQLITEVGAICMYLADKFPEGGLAPPIGSPQRAAGGVASAARAGDADGAAGRRRHAATACGRRRQ